MATSKLHDRKALELGQLFKDKYGCQFIAYEYSTTVKTYPNNPETKSNYRLHHYRFDVYGVDANRNKYIGEVGTIQADKKRVLEALARSRTDTFFIHVPYSQRELEQLDYEENVYVKYRDKPSRKLEIPNSINNYDVSWQYEGKLHKAYMTSKQLENFKHLALSNQELNILETKPIIV